jgi:hypothetical protein
MLNSPIRAELNEAATATCVGGDSQQENEIAVTQARR